MRYTEQGSSPSPYPPHPYPDPVVTYTQRRALAKRRLQQHQSAMALGLPSPYFGQQAKPSDQPMPSVDELASDVLARWSC